MNDDVEITECPSKLSEDLDAIEELMPSRCLTLLSIGVVVSGRLDVWRCVGVSCLRSIDVASPELVLRYTL